jgi:hypothetical protein
MNKLKAVATVFVVIAFFAYCMWLSPFLFGNRIRSEMLKDSILKYDSGANIYIASKDDNSKVYFGKSGVYKFYGTGALTYMASPKSQESDFRSCFNLLIEGGNLELKTGQADILTGSVSPNGQFLALLKIDGKLSIHNISTGKTTYESTESFIVGNPLKQNNSSYPFFYWTDQGLIVAKKNNPIVSNTSNKEDIEHPLTFYEEKAKETQLTEDKTDKNSEQKNEERQFTEDETEIIGSYDMRTNTWSNNIFNSNLIQLVSIEPTTGNINIIPTNNSKVELLYAIGIVDADNLLVSYIFNSPADAPGVFNLRTSIITELPDLPTDIIGFSNDKLFFVKDNVLVSSTITAKSSSAPASINLPELDGEKLAPDKIENLRVTSKGYLYFRHIKTAKTYLLDPDTGVYVEIPKERYPY